MGYADGYRRSLSGRSWVGLRGKRAPVLGRVSMDQMVVGIPEGVPVAAGDMVHLIADDPALAAPSALDLARLMDTNAYEVLVGLRQRVPRVFVRGGEVVAIRRAGDRAGEVE
jgi:alanine racemase